MRTEIGFPVNNLEDQQVFGQPTLRWRRFLSIFRKLARNPLSLVGIVSIIIFIFIAFTATIWVPYPADIRSAPNISGRLQAPTAKHLFGTDELGRDIFTRVMVGTNVSLRVGVVVVTAAALVGSLVGLLAGYVGGWVNSLLMRITDGFLAFPSLVLALTIAAAMGPSLIHAMFAIILVWWPWYARLVRSTAMQIRNELYVVAAQSLGANTWSILFWHVLPNSFVPILVQASMDFGYVILAAASLSFIGVGEQPPSPEWGLMVNAGRSYFPNWWWMITFPGLAIFLAVLSFNLIGDGLREVLDPRLSRKA